MEGRRNKRDETPLLLTGTLLKGLSMYLSCLMQMFKYSLFFNRKELTIPVVANGSISQYEEIKRCLSITEVYYYTLL